MINRKKKLLFNTVSSLLLQIVTVLCGFILPRAILAAFGSEVNGLVNSITQFLGIVSFFELGIGSVVQSSLYKPLSENNTNSISKIYVSASKFFRILARIMLLYVLVLLVIYPKISNQSFGWMFTDLLVIALSISLFAQYYFGLVNQILLNADQKGYIQCTVQIITLIINTVASVILIKCGASIHMVKLSTAFIYLIRPLFLDFYVKKHYSIDKKVTYTEEPIQQKWNGVAQHISFVVLQDTDNIVLTVFSTLSNVSIYSVYNMVILGVKQLLISLTSGFKSLFGELWAKKEIDELNNTFAWFEWLIHTLTVLFFGCTGVLIIPFVRVYTNGITDANYIQPLFAILIIIANALHCFRLPYNTIILSAGHYKQTQTNSIVTAIMNLSISILMVFKFGLIGVAIGTLISMLYQTVWMAFYISKNINKWPIKRFYKQVLVDIITTLIGIIATSWVSLSQINYFSWIVMSLKVVSIWIIICIFINFILYKDMMKKLTIRIKHKII